MNNIVVIPATSGEFAENKDEAKRLRQEFINPLVDEGKEVVLDFSGTTYATQSFIHALVGEALQRHREKALNLIDFRNCSTQIRTIVELVVDYSLGGFYSERDASQRELPLEEKGGHGSSGSTPQN